MTRLPEIEAELRHLITSGEWECMKALLLGYKSEGFSSADIMAILLPMQKEFENDDALYDNFLVVGDVVSGWCRKDARIWHD